MDLHVHSQTHDATGEIVQSPCSSVLGGRRPGASAPPIRRVTRHYANGLQGNTKLQRRSALLPTVSHTCRDINTVHREEQRARSNSVRVRVHANGTCTHWHTRRNQHVNICTHAMHKQQHRSSSCLSKMRTTQPQAYTHGVYFLIRVDDCLC